MLQPMSDAPHSTHMPPVTLRALLLDDSAFDRTRIRRISRTADIQMEIEEVPTIAEMKNAIDRTAFDLVLIDYRLTEGDGLEALQLAQDHPQTRDAAKIMIAGAAQTSVVVSALKNGCHDFIAKEDLSPDMMREAVTGALRRAGKLPGMPVGTTVSLNHDALQGAVEKSVKEGVENALRVLGLGEAAENALQTELFLAEFCKADDFEFKN